jgi:hypothetical protein
MMNYLNFDLEAFDHKQTETGDHFSVRVASSPGGEQRIGEADKVKMPMRVRQRIGALQRRQLSLAEIIALGEELGKALFPPRVRSFLSASLNRLRSDDEGLRIRLMLDTYGLAELPWEYVYLPSPDVPDERRGPEGFLALNRRVSLVRYELQGKPLVSMDPGVSPIRLVALLASPHDPSYAPLDVAVEQRSIQQAVGDLTAIQPDFYPEATADTLLDALVKPAHIFHFSGHGEFKGDMSERYGSQKGAGAVILLDDKGGAKAYSAQRLAITLTGRSVRLAVLTACEVGQRDAVNAWAGVVTALTHVDIPAVVGMQYRIRDTNAIAFSKAFYRALAAGQPIDAAVADGRFAIFNCGDDNERDWGVPVLYLRAVDGVLFPHGGKPVVPGAPALQEIASNATGKPPATVDKRTLRDAVAPAQSKLRPDTAQPSQPLWARIDNPGRRQIVERTIECRGLAVGVPHDVHLWLAVEAGDLIWPKEPEVHVERDGTWKGVIFEDGSAKRFSVSLWMADQQADKYIREWLDAGRPTGAYSELKGIPGRATRLMRVDDLRLKILRSPKRSPKPRGRHGR